MRCPCQGDVVDRVPSTLLTETASCGADFARIMTADGAASSTISPHHRPDQELRLGDGDLKAGFKEGHPEHRPRLERMRAKFKDGLAWYIYGHPQQHNRHP